MGSVSKKTVYMFTFYQERNSISTIYLERLVVETDDEI